MKPEENNRKPTDLNRSHANDNNGEPAEARRQDLRRVYLEVADAADGQKHVVIDEGAGVLIGRGPEVDLNVQDDLYADALHARLRWIDGELMLDDMASHNGVLIMIRQPVALRDGDVFFIGTTRFHVAFKSPQAGGDRR